MSTLISAVARRRRMSKPSDQQVEAPDPVEEEIQEMEEQIDQMIADVEEIRTDLVDAGMSVH